MTDCRASCDSGDCKSGELFTGLAQACDDGGDSCECCLVPAGCRMTDCRARCDTGDCKSGEFFTGVTQHCDDGREACECCNASPTPTPPPPVPTPTPPAPTPPPPTPVPSAGVHDPFGGTWYKGTADDSKYSVSFTSTSVTWNFQNTHLENDGIATHFDPVPLEQDETVSFLMVWNSGAPPYDKDGCTSKYWTGSKYEYQCYDEGGGTDSYPWVVDGCRKEPHCLVNTGDFRVVLADSNGARLAEDGFLDLDDVSKDWEGIQWRLLPHTGLELQHHSPNIPCNILFKHKDGGMFSTDSMTKAEIFSGCFAVQPYVDTLLELNVTKRSGLRIDTTISMNGHSYSNSYEYAGDKFVPNQIDTFAIAQPNLRGYTVLEMSRHPSL